MYSRTVRDEGGAPLELLDFGVSGNLWHGVLVMYDRSTGSFWTQLDGRAIEGTHAGRRLDHVDSTFTTWSQWRAVHPDTEVLFKPEEERGQTASAYADYLADPERLFLARLGEGLGGGVAPKDTVFGVVIEGTPWAVTESLLAEAGTVTVCQGSTSVVLSLDRETGKVSSSGGHRVDRAFWYAWSRSHTGSRIMAH